jgi:hypothetical protein
MSTDERAPRGRWLNWTTLGTVAGVIACVILIVAITVGRDACSHKDFPVACLAAQLFR